MGNIKSKIKIGPLGESIVCRFLSKNGYTIIERNYRKIWGEIDIVAEKNSTVHFFEVKTVSREPNKFGGQGIRPEENLHKSKIQRLNRAIQSYLQGHNIGPDRAWQLDAALVWLDIAKKDAEIELLENIGL